VNRRNKTRIQSKVKVVVDSPFFNSGILQPGFKATQNPESDFSAVREISRKGPLIQVSGETN
jgi:hypothetical protein